jgi:Pyruvate/2-oxoglutarate dehydrogenase complex, dihydrolipoamide dehydrogenase (E3) component, and related enzymes
MTDYDLVIVGAGSGKMLPTAVLKGMRVAIIKHDRFGGTCLNRNASDPSRTTDVGQRTKTW